MCLYHGSPRQPRRVQQRTLRIAQRGVQLCLIRARNRRRLQRVDLLAGRRKTLSRRGRRAEVDVELLQPKRCFCASAT